MPSDDAQFGDGMNLVHKPVHGPCRVPRIKCGKCGYQNHIDTASGEYQGYCVECYAFLRRPTDKEYRRFGDFMGWKTRFMDFSD